MKIGIFYNRDQADLSVAEDLAAQIGAAGHEAVIFSELEEIGGVDRLLALGGDGTMLRAAKHASALKIPLLGINLSAKNVPWLFRLCSMKIVRGSSVPCWKRS